MKPDDGLRYQNNADQIAVFEWGGSRASLYSSRIVREARPGRSESEVMGASGLRGEPMLYHPIITSGPNVHLGLKSPSARELAANDAIFTSIGIWGGNCGRSGILASAISDLPQARRGFIDEVALPYWRVLAAWYENLRLGVVGGELHAATVANCKANGFSPLLNTSHLQDWEDWPTTIFHKNATATVASGMCIAADIFSSRNGQNGMMHCEDTLCVADETLRAELRERYPECWSRMAARRRFMQDVLGLDIAGELLPFSVMPAYLPPLWLASNWAVRVAT